MLSLASIDIGSNTIRLLIGRAERNRIIRLRYEMVITRLAEGIAETGLLKTENAEKSVSVLKEFSRLISTYNVSHIKAIGTSAVREAKNSEEFIQRVLSEAGIKIEIVPGKKEAELTAKGVVLGMSRSGLALIVDIGGGSTEWILCENSSPVKVGTIPTGVVKLFENHIKSDPPSRDDIVSLNKEAEAVSGRLKAEIGHLINSNTVFIGTAGTVTTLASIDLGLETYNHEKIHMHNMPLQRLCDIAERLINVPLSERKKLRGLEPERADLIIPGILFTINIMKLFDFKDILVSDNGLLEGILVRLSEEVSH